jgi:LysR family hca operon transcriptional activator
VELRHLKYFAAVAEHLNFTRAAAALHVAQPALSVQIRQLEAEIGVELLRREGRRTALTEAGRIFLKQAHKTLADARMCAILAQQAQQGEIGQLSIGHNAPAGFLVFPKVVPAFRRQWPSVHLTFHSLSIAQQLDGLLREELDLGVVWLPVPAPDFDVAELIHEPIVAVLPAEHRLASKDRVSIKDLSRELLILASRALHPDIYHHIEQQFAQAGSVLNVVYQLETSLSMINFVAMGVGIALLPQYVRSIHQDGVVYRPLRACTLVRTLAIVKKKGRGELADVFFRFARDCFGNGPSRREQKGVSAKS